MAPLTELFFTYTFGWLFAAVLTYAGFRVVRRGFELRRQRQLVLDTPTEDVESVSMGPSELFGTARSVEEPLEAPFSDEDCLVAIWRVEEYRDDHDDDGGSWRTVESGTESVPFYLDDGTGWILVEPHPDVEYTLGDEPRIDVDAGDEPPAPVRRFLEREGVAPVARRLGSFLTVQIGTKEGDRRYYQRLLQPGEDVYVFGTVQRDESVEGDVVVRRPDGAATPFMIGDAPEAEVAAARRWAMWRLPAGAGIVTLGVLGLGYMTYWTATGVLDVVRGVASLFGVGS